MDLTALTWQASVVLIYVSFYREAGVANATLASFLCPRPSLASRQLGSPSLAAFSRIRYRVCALAASVLSLRTCQERTAILITRRQHRSALHPGPAEHPPYPRSNQCLALARVRRQASGLMSMPETHPAAPRCSFARLGRVLT
jgi:hypothetical protein